MPRNVLLWDVAEIVADGEIHPVPGEPINSFYAATGRDALAQYSLAAGFSDPRESEEEDYFTDWTDDVTTMVFTNTELIATLREEN